MLVVLGRRRTLNSLPAELLPTRREFDQREAVKAPRPRPPAHPRWGLGTRKIRLAGRTIFRSPDPRKTGPTSAPGASVPGLNSWVVARLCIPPFRDKPDKSVHGRFELRTGSNFWERSHGSLFWECSSPQRAPGEDQLETGEGSQGAMPIAKAGGLHAPLASHACNKRASSSSNLDSVPNASPIRA
jgi:hypothetical protein